MKFRLLPIAVFVATALFAVKIAEVWRGVEAFIATPSYAQSAQPQTAPTQTGQQTESQPTPGAANTAPEGARSAARPSVASDEPMLMSQSEIDLLQKLSQRRGELENWGNDLSMRENLLKAAELRLEAKLGELRGMQDKIQASLKRHDEEQEAKLKSLVKIYETMKPKDAAPIFEQLEMAILLDVIERMKEAKVAPIIAAMDPQKAKALTTDLVKRRRLAGEESQKASEQASRTD